MRNAYIIYSQFFDRAGTEIRIGGIETYIYNLSKVFISKGFAPIIYQFANDAFEREYEGIKVVGVKTKSRSYRRNSRLLAKEVQKLFDEEKDIVVFASEEYVVPFKSRNVIAIQHGISWDIPNNKHHLVNYFKNALRAVVEYQRVNKCSRVVCVDYNFVNWYRATFKKYDYDKFHVIANFCDTQCMTARGEHPDKVKIIFARRFVEHRGAILFACVTKRILDKYPNVEICFAGEGPCGEEMKEILANTPNVRFTSFTADESIAFHSEFDISVIPTIGSEGTSLSLLEAMAAGCAVVSTNVGGITNILIDGYNGSIVNATEEDILQAVEKLIEDEKLRNSYIANGLNTVQKAFDRTIWQSKWSDIIGSLE